VSFDLSKSPSDHILLQLPREDLDLVMELVLRSGSLKDLAAAYGVSYPTIRLRLDKVIERLEGLRRGQQPDAMTELLASLVERGEITPSAARAVREVARRNSEGGGP
jgi:hypothetical protein